MISSDLVVAPDWAEEITEEDKTDTNLDTKWDFREARGVLRNNNKPVTESAAEAISRIRRQRLPRENEL